MEVNVVRVRLQIFFDLGQKLSVLFVTPRVAEGKPIIFGGGVELELERNFRAFFLGFLPLSDKFRKFYPDETFWSAIPLSVLGRLEDRPHPFLTDFVLQE